MDLHLSISDGFVKTEVYDKRDNFDFDIVNSPFLDGDVLKHMTSFGVYISQLILLLECPVMLMTLILVIKFLQQNFLKKDINLIIFRRLFLNFIGGIST